MTLRAAQAERKGGKRQAVDLLQQAISLQDQLRYNEPPDWSFPVRESLGGLYLRMQLFSTAEKTFREDLEKHPRNGRSLFGLWKSLQGQNRLTDAFWVKREWDLAWKNSTVPLSISTL